MGSENTDSWDDELDGEFCRAVAETVPEAILTIGRDKTIVFANPATEGVFGIGPQALIGQHIRTLIPERRRDEQLNRLEQSVCAVDTTAGPTTLELQAEREAGTEISVSISFREHTYDGERVFTGVVRDVSAVKQQTRELEEQRVLFERIQDLGDIGAWEYDLQTGELTWSSGVHDIHGVEPSFEPTLETALDFYHSDDTEKIQRLVDRALDEGTSFDADLRIVRPDGDVRDVRTLGDVVAGADGQPALLYGVFQDVTQRKERERDLERYEALAENMDEVAFVVNRDWDLEYMNRTAVPYTDRTTEEVTGRSVVSLASEFATTNEQAERVERALQTVFEGDTDTENRLELRQEFPHGEVVVEYQFSSFVSDGEQKVVIVARDVTERRERERELVQSQKRQRALFNQSPDGIVVHDEKGAILDVNDQTVSDLGYSREELLSMNAADIEVDYDDDELIQRWASLDIGEKLKIEGRHRRQDDSTFPVEIWINKVEFDENSRFVALSRDITARKARERKLRRFRKAVEQTAHSVYITDTDGTIEYVNAAFEEQTGYAATMAVGQTPDILNSGAHDAAYFDEMWETILSGEIWKQEIVNERADGSEYYADQTIAPIEDDSGEIEAFVAVNRDITERREMEEELRRSEIRFRMMFERHSAPMLLIDPESGNIEGANDAAAEFYGYPWAELTALQIDDINCQPSTAVETERKRAEREERNHFVFEHRLASGDTRTVEVHSSPIPTEDDELLFSIVHDITERKEYEQRLKQQRDNLELLNQMVRHDIRNDLQLILAYVELLEEQVDETGTEYIETVVDSAENAVELTRSARDLADVMLQTETEHEPIDIQRTLEGQLDEIRGMYADAVVTVDGEVPDVRVRANDMLKSVFRNLLKNAIEHNDKNDPEVTVSVTARTDSVRARVADNGPGIPEEQRSVIFGKGEKGLESDGTGIGLYLVHTLVEQYGGEVWVEDNDPAGSVFIVELPRAE